MSGRRVLTLRYRLARRAVERRAQIFRWIGRHPLLAGMVGMLAASLMAALTFLAFYNGRAEELRHAAENSHNLVAIIAADLQRSVAIYDVSLQGVVADAERPETWTLPLYVRQRVLFDRGMSSWFFGDAYVLDAQGYVKASQTGRAYPGISFARRDYFLVHQANPSLGLYISRPYASQVRNGALAVAISRRINGPNDAFAGVALVSFRIEYFGQLVDRIDLGPNGGAFIMLDDGTLLAGRPATHGGVGANYANTPIFPLLAKQQSGTFVSKDSADRVERIYTFAHVPGAPLIVGIAPAVDDVLANWRDRSELALLMTALFGGAYVVVSWLFAFALRDKVLAEAELQRIASTDALTGLNNRRAFDHRLAQEWRRAVRERTPLALLFMDIDYFKRFNDTYGHAMGDEVLSVVAERIVSGTRRPPDFAARYGGEEVAVVLPNTELEGALKVAEKIRKRVESAGLENNGAESGHVTISVGCSACRPHEGGSAAKLLAAADAQLYAAKAAGRNQVR